MERRILSNLRDVLPDVLRRLDHGQQLEAYTIWTFWDEEVGAHIARRAQPSRFRNGILFVAVATHSWLQELQFMKDELRERLNSRLGTPLVRDIFFISGNVKAAAPASPSAVTAELSGPVEAMTLPPLDDPKLAAAFARLATNVARRRVQLSPPRPKTRRRTR
jgi:hypothetical protein